MSNEPWIEAPHIWKTEDDFWSYIEEELFQRIWKTWPPKKEWIKRNELDKGFELRPRGLKTVKGWEDVLPFVQSICCGLDELELVAQVKKLRSCDKRQYYVYWIKSPEHTDIYTQGYVGVTLNPEVRLLQHLNNAKNHTTHKYAKGFREVLLSGNFEFIIQDTGTLDFCMDKESELRGELYIGWNRAIGGDGGVVYKHGLTGSKTSKTYYNILTRAKDEGEQVYADWLGTDGLENFSKFYADWEKSSGQFSLIEKGAGYCPENLIKMSRSQIIRRAYQKYTIGDGVLYSVSELAEKFHMKANTISVRIRDGWSVREAVGLDPRIDKSKQRGVK